jgi:hypothetical protein
VVPVAEGVPELSGLGVLTWVYPPDLVDRVVAACGRAEQRRRRLPARLVVYFVLALALFSPASYLEVLRHLTEGLRDLGRWGSWRMPAKSSRFRARERLGAEPLRVLFAATARPLATPSTPGAFWRGLRLMAVDGSCWDAADTPANDKEFGRPGTHRGEGGGAFPQVRMVALVECGTHAVVDAELDGCRVGEVTLAARVARSAGPGMLVLADREFLGVPLWPWPPPGRTCCGGCRPTGSWTSSGRCRPARRDPVRVRVVASTLDDPGRTGAGEYRLVTDLLDHQRYPADELAALYAQRWEQETALDELKTHQRGPGVVLASKTPTASASRSGPTCWPTTPCAR